MAGDRVIAQFRRTPYRMFVAACIGSFVAIGLIRSIASGGDAGAQRVSGVGDLPGLVSAWGAIALVALVALVAWVRLGVVARQSGLTIRNLVRREHVGWDAIDRFERPAPYGSTRHTGLQIHMRDGRVIHAFLYSAGPFNRPEFADAVITELEALRQRMAASDRETETGSESPDDFGSNAGSNASRTVTDPPDHDGR